MKTNVAALLSRVQAMEFLGGISPSTLWRLEHQGSLKPIRIGRRVLFRQEDLDRLVAKAIRSPVRVEVP